MVVYKEKYIALDSERERMKKVKYTKGVRKKLNALYDLFEVGDFDGCIKMSSEWDKDDRECILEGVWDVLFNINMGGVYYKPEKITEMVIKAGLEISV